MKKPILRTLALAPALFLLCHLSALGGETPAKSDAAIAEIKGDAAKIALKELDTEIDRVDAMIENAPTSEDKAAAKARMEVLKQRRGELRRTYAQARYDELKADLRAEASRLSAWTKRTFTRDPAEKAADEIKDSARAAREAAATASDHVYAQAATVGAATDIADYKLRPTDTNKEEARAALKALNQRIALLGDRAKLLPAGPEREAAKSRVKALEARKDALEQEFNKARLDALIDDVKQEWQELRS